MEGYEERVNHKMMNLLTFDRKQAWQAFCHTRTPKKLIHPDWLKVIL